ncbi:MAG TPA: hypothetical protein VMJ10_20285, partial [Kofleriaceae bacterium]|nr:hypothetical protein [Kofleriaceae bacterium]
VVIDWGLAKVVGEVETPSEDPRPPLASDSLHTQAGSVFGTPGFMPPEQARGDELGPRSDVFALGATLYHLLAGRPPVTGRSATEVLEATFKHALVPIARACPEAPPELIAIVDKALAPEPEGRYGDAAALAEDVRRFLTGQLVAAHRYTRRQRLARFVRRHRAVLAVGVLAVAALAVLATIGVRRIVAERDAAHAAEATAQQKRGEAEDARRDAEKQRDAQLVARAEALLETDPTKAAALLAGLPAHSDMLEDARAIAQAAQVRGVAFGIATSEGTVIGNQLSPDARYLAQTTLEGSFAVYDLDTRRRVLDQKCERGTRPLWLAGGKELLLYSGLGPSHIIDPATGQVRPDGTLSMLDRPIATASGDRVVYLDATGHAFRFDVATRTATAIPGEHVSDIAIARDGSWYAVADRVGVTVYDRKGTVLAARPGAISLLAGGDGHVAVVARDTGKVLELALDHPTTWVERPIALGPSEPVLWLVYRGDRLFVAGTQHPLAPWDAPAAVATSAHAYVGIWAGNAIVALSTEGTLLYSSLAGVGSIRLPIAVQGDRVTGLPGKSRVVIATDGRALVYDLDDVLARVIDVPERTEPTFVDDDLLVMSGIPPEWGWYDLAADKHVPWSKLYLGANQLLDVDRAGRRVLRVMEDNPRHAELLVGAPGQPDRSLGFIAPAMPPNLSPPARFVPGGAIVFGDKQRVLAAIGTGMPYEVAAFESTVVELVACGRLQVAAVTDHGELARIHLATGQIERVHVAGAGSIAVAADDDGRIWIAIGKKVQVWDGSLREVATLARDVVSLAPAAGGAVAIEHGMTAELVSAAGGKPRELLGPEPDSPAVSADGRVVAGISRLDRLHVVELPAGTVWDLPIGSVTNGNVALSPSRRLVVQRWTQSGHALLFVRKLPRADPDLHTWLAGLTNAEIGPDGTLRWK